MILGDPNVRVNLLTQETFGYGSLLSGDIQSALERLGPVERHEPTRRWEQEMVDRASRIARLLRAGELQAATEQLLAWRKQTLASLGIDPADSSMSVGN